jgi:acyl carrier protein
MDSDGTASAESVIREYITREVVARPGLPPVENDTKLIESGILDSLSVLNLVLFLEKKFGVKVAPEDIVQENFETVERIIKYLRDKGSS